MNHALPDVVPIFKVLLCDIVHHPAKEATNITLGGGIKYRKNKAALFMAGKSDQIAVTATILAELNHISNASQATVTTIGPGMIGAAESLSVT